MRLLLAVFLFSSFLFASEDVWFKHKDALYQSAKEYVATFATEKEFNKWKTLIDEKLETRSLETVALDWFFDNQESLEDQLPSAIKAACFFFIKFVETDTAPPKQLRSVLTEQNIVSICDFLTVCVGKVKR